MIEKTKGGNLCAYLAPKMLKVVFIFSGWKFLRYFNYHLFFLFVLIIIVACHQVQINNFLSGCLHWLKLPNYSIMCPFHLFIFVLDKPLKWSVYFFFSRYLDLFSIPLSLSFFYNNKFSLSTNQILWGLWFWGWWGHENLLAAYHDIDDRWFPSSNLFCP